MTIPNRPSALTTPGNSCCCYPQLISTTTTCRRRIIWRLIGVGDMCHYHFERYIVSHDIDFAIVRRLSDNDRDFIAHDGKGSGSNQWQRRWSDEVAG